MPVSPSSAAQAARRSVAHRLRELRAEAGISGGELGRRCDWKHSKTSRIENAITPPTPEDIRRWCGACGAPDQAADIVAQSQNAESLYLEWQRRVRSGLKQLQTSYVPLFQSTRLFRVYSATLLPHFLQTEGYAAGLLTAITTFREIPDDVADAVAARLERNQILREPGRRFVLLVEEAALRYQLADAEAMAAQLGYLMTAGAMPTVSLGVIPMTARERTQWPLETFHMYDDTLVSVELLSARVKVTQPSEIALYDKAFSGLQQMAVYGAEARALIMNAVAALR
ncbi:helix-turn-helix domain-containing protein [Streptomyces sp. ISL-44]|uniref:helix-turn-helix domain-containing protein n=1 Tax=Streptomyces sp. ISL-44 TaxID=2819184 RepID=UPI001BEC9444|nr:helix-turn-helix transcriptional regulator [Streptomyces sp. ISL-44]MBT2542034.1 helix-turn-helix domain-containing protein [Streptomyces sp. ISL-44]